jgi:hypothetical protein
LFYSKLEQYPETVATIAQQPESMLKIGIIFCSGPIQLGQQHWRALMLKLGRQIRNAITSGGR